MDAIPLLIGLAFFAIWIARLVKEERRLSGKRRSHR